MALFLRVKPSAIPDDTQTTAWILWTGLCDAQLTGPVVVPFNLEKQTALLSVMARNFPRLSLGFGPVQTHVVSVLDDAAARTAQVTLLTVSNGGQQAFAEVHNAPRPSCACNSIMCCPALALTYSKIHVSSQLVCLLGSNFGFTCSVAREPAMCDCYLRVFTARLLT